LNKTFILKFLLLLYFTSSYISATHIHKQISNLQDSCKVHILIKNISGGDSSLLDNLHLLFDCERCENYNIYFDKFLTSYISKGYNSQAPPICS